MLFQGMDIFERIVGELYLNFVNEILLRLGFANFQHKSYAILSLKKQIMKKAICKRLFKLSFIIKRYISVHTSTIQAERQRA